VHTLRRDIVNTARPNKSSPKRSNAVKHLAPSPHYTLNDAQKQNGGFLSSNRREPSYETVRTTGPCQQFVLSVLVVLVLWKNAFSLARAFAASKIKIRANKISRSYQGNDSQPSSLTVQLHSFCSVFSKMILPRGVVHA